ncbi:TPA: hypothetical protein QCN73_003246 [Bacillus wiedmannii]|nr:hypothetical protein [Bacillus wiedmannii]
MYIEHDAVVKEIEDYSRKPNVLDTLKGYPYSDLEDRQFEVLVYSLFKEEIERGNLKQFDSINLMQGVGERGRDCSLHYQGTNVGLIQCKKYQNRLNKPQTAKEIIKFCLYYLQDNGLITDINKFEYYIAVSNDFSGTAIELIEDFNKKIIVEENLEKWTEDVIKNYVAFNGIKYNTIKSSLLEVLCKIKVKKITANNLNLLLEKYGYIQSFFFSVKTVISIEANREMIKEALYDSNHMFYDCIKRFISNSNKDDEPQKTFELDKELASTADEYFRIHDYKNALDTYIHLVGKIKSEEIQVHIKHRQGLCHYHLANKSNDKKESFLENSVADFLEAIRIAGENASYSLFKDLGVAYFELSSIRNAVLYLKKSKEAQKEALKKCDKMAFLNDYLDIKNKLAITYLDMAEYENVKENVGKAMEIFIGILNQDKILNSLAWAVFNNIGRCYLRLAFVSNDDEAKKYYQNAIDYYNEALNIVNMVDSPKDYILIRNNQGAVYLSISQLTDDLKAVEDALRCFNEVFEICKKDVESFQYCQVLNNLGIVYFQFYKKNHCKDDLIKAIYYYHKSLEHKEISERPIMHGRTQMNYGISLFHLAKIEDKEKNLNAAIQAFDWSIKLSPKPNSNQNQAARSEQSKAFIEKGLLFEDVNYINLAINNLISLIEEVREINVELNNLHYTFFRNLTGAYIALQKIEKDELLIISTFEKVLSICIEYNYKVGVAHLSGKLGLIYQKLYCENSSSDLINLDSAKYYFQISAKYCKELQNKYHTSLAIYNLTNVYLLFYFEEYKIEYLKKAEEYCEEALKYIRHVLDEEANHESHELYREIQEQLSVIADHK